MNLEKTEKNEQNEATPQNYQIEITQSAGRLYDAILHETHGGEKYWAVIFVEARFFFLYTDLRSELTGLQSSA